MSGQGTPALTHVSLSREQFEDYTAAFPDRSGANNGLIYGF